MKQYEEILKELLAIIPKEEIEKCKDTMHDFRFDFGGFVGQYYYLSKIIPTNYTIIDFGAGYNAQSYFFLNHEKYIAVEPLSGIEQDDGMFCPPNCDIYRMTTNEFLNSINYPKKRVFAICNYVPNWYGENSSELIRSHFNNCFTFYP